MDCCNYMQQHRQTYYGSHYYEGGAMPPYTHDYHPHQYSIGAHHYNAPNWAFAASCTDYVYNPKEARIRKALRDRERSIGGGQVGAQRARRSPHWPKNSVHLPATPSNTIMGAQAKERHSVIRTDADNGFISGNGGYMYPAQNYQFPAHVEYANFMNPAAQWPPNAYVQTQSATDTWTNFQQERLRMQANQASSYIMPSSNQTAQYHNIEQMQIIGQASKPNLLDNLENNSMEPDRFLNMTDSMEEHTETENSQLDISTTVSESIPSVEQNNTTDMSRAHSLPNMTENIANATLRSEESGSGNISSNTNNILNIGNMPSEINSKDIITSVDAIFQLENVVDKADNTFNGIQLFEDDALPNISSAGLSKSMDTQSLCILEPTSFTVESIDSEDFILNPFGGDNMLCSFSTPILHVKEEVSDNEDTKLNILEDMSMATDVETELPLDFSIEKYETMLFEDPVAINNYFCDENGFLKINQFEDLETSLLIATDCEGDIFTFNMEDDEKDILKQLDKSDNV